RSVSAPSSVTNTSPCWNGESVPGSTLMYGSNFWIVTRRPRSTSSRPIDAAAIPFPSDETTPPVTKMYLVGCRLCSLIARCPSGGLFTPQPLLRPHRIRRRIHAASRLRHHADADRQSCIQRPQLLQPFDR